MNKTEQKLRRQIRVRSKVRGSSERPRLSVFRSNKHLYAQLINDDKGVTILGVSEKNLPKSDDKKIVKARNLGKMLGNLAIAKKIKKAVFDKSGYKYHGIVKEIAEGAREEGLVF